MLHVFCMSLIKIIGRNFVLADLFDLSPNKENNNKVRCKLTLRVSKYDKCIIPLVASAPPPPPPAGGADAAAAAGRNGSVGLRRTQRKDA